MSKPKARKSLMRKGETRKRGKNVSAPKPAAKAKATEAALPDLPASIKTMAHAMKGLAPVIESVAKLRMALPRFSESQLRFMLAGQRAREMVSMCQQDASLNEILEEARSYLQSVGGADDDLACWLLVYAVGKGGALQEEVEKAVREHVSQIAREAVRFRSDQKTKAAFLDWAKKAIQEGKRADTVSDLQGLEGFKPVWSQKRDATLKHWAKEAGFKLKTGRPKKKK